MNKLITLIAASLMLFGCASNVNQTVKQPIVKSTNSVNAIYLVVSHSENVPNDKDFASIKQDLITQVSKKAKIKIPNVQIITSSAPMSGIVATVEIQELRYVSGAARFMAGALSGKAKLGARLEIADIVSKQIKGELLLGTSSKFSEGIFGGTTGRQVEAVSEQIVNQLKELSSN